MVLHSVRRVYLEAQGLDSVPREAGRHVAKVAETLNYALKDESEADRIEALEMLAHDSAVLAVGTGTAGVSTAQKKALGVKEWLEDQGVGGATTELAAAYLLIKKKQKRLTRMYLISSVLAGVTIWSTKTVGKEVIRRINLKSKGYHVGEDYVDLAESRYSWSD